MKQLNCNNSGGYKYLKQMLSNHLFDRFRAIYRFVTFLNVSQKKMATIPCSVKLHCKQNCRKNDTILESSSRVRGVQLIFCFTVDALFHEAGKKFNIKKKENKK